MIAVALLDGEVQPSQYEPARIVAADVQALLRKVTVTADAALTSQFPQRLPADLEVELGDGTVLRAQRSDYRGFHTDPFDWPTARAKFDRVTAGFTSAAERDALADVIAALQQRPLVALTSVLARVCPRVRTE
jgi:2-methylcitrate dehydratase